LQPSKLVALWQHNNERFSQDDLDLQSGFRKRSTDQPNIDPLLAQPRICLSSLNAPTRGRAEPSEASWRSRDSTITIMCSTK
jgi:hypothetical protein